MVLILALLYSLFDYLNFNIVIRPAMTRYDLIVERPGWRRLRHIVGRALQIFVGCGLLWLLRNSNPWELLVAVAWQLFWVYDFLYYLWAFYIDRWLKVESKFEWEGERVVKYVLSRANLVEHAWWTPAAWLARPHPPNGEAVKLQAVVSLLWGIVVCVISWVL